MVFSIGSGNESQDWAIFSGHSHQNGDPFKLSLDKPLRIINGVDPQAQLLQWHLFVKLGLLGVVIEPDTLKVELDLSLVVDCFLAHDADVGEEVGDALYEVGLDLVVSLRSPMPYICDGIVAPLVVFAKVGVLGTLLCELGGLEGELGQD